MTGIKISCEKEKLEEKFWLHFFRDHRRYLFDEIAAFSNMVRYRLNGSNSYQILI